VFARSRITIAIHTREWMAIVKEAPKYLRRVAAAAYLKSKYGIGSANWLAKLAVTGGGPEYVKNGVAPLYTEAGLDAWMQGRMTRRASTSVALDDTPAGQNEAAA
jgi:hypothetical protein